MNLRKLSLSVFSALLGILIFPTVSQAVSIVSQQINKVSVSFIASEDANILKGKIWKEADLKDAVKVKLELFDSQKALILREELEAPKSQKKENYWEMDFDLDLTGKNLVGNYTLKAEILNDIGRTFAFGEGVKKFQKPENGESREISLISDLALKVDKDLIKGGIKFVNNEVDGDFKAKIDVYKDDNKRSYIGTFLSESFAIKKGESEEMFFSFKTPQSPQLYYAEVSVLQKEQEITGKIIKEFLVPGDFGEFAGITISPQKYIEKGDSIEVEFSGNTTAKDNVLSVEIEVTDNAGFSAKKFVNVSAEDAFGNFKGKEIFLATQGLEQVFVKVKLWEENKQLAEMNKSTKIFAKTKNINFVSKIKDLKTGGTLSASDKVKIIVVLILIVLAIVIFIRGLIRSNKSKNFFIFFCLILASGTTFASYPTGHFFPQNGMSYNLTADSNFNKLGFWGYVSSSVGGWMPGDNKEVLYRVLFNEGEFETKELRFVSENTYEYKFSFDLNPANFENEILPVDGEYKLTLIMYGDAIENRFDEIGKPDETEIKMTFEDSNTDDAHLIYIDRKEPVISFKYNKNDATSTIINNGPTVDYQQGDYVNSEFQITPVCGDEIGCSKDFARFPVKGNFCDETVDNRTFCSSGNVHEFKICDKAGNCNIKSADIDFYDPVKPKSGGGGFVDSSGGSIFNDENWPSDSGIITEPAVCAAYCNNEVGGGFNYIIGEDYPFSVGQEAFNSCVEANCNLEGGSSEDSGVLSGIEIAMPSGYSFGLSNTSDPATGDYTENGGDLLDAYVCARSTEFIKFEGICVEKEQVCALSAWGRGVSSDDGTTCEIKEVPEEFECLQGVTPCELVPTCYYDRFPYCFDLIIE